MKTSQKSVLRKILSLAPGLWMLALAAPAQPAEGLSARFIPPVSAFSIDHPCSRIAPKKSPFAALPLPTYPARPPRCRRRAETARPFLALKGPPPDSWLGFDKAQHAAFSFLWTLGSQYTLVNKIGVSEARALPFSLGTGALLGLTKEVYDARLGPHRHFSYRDLAANALGLLLATGVIAL